MLQLWNSLVKTFFCIKVNSYNLLIFPSTPSFNSYIYNFNICMQIINS